LGKSAGPTVDGKLSEALCDPVQHGATLPWMPTSHPRHTITETPALHEVLEELRAALGRGRIDFGELTMLGARAKLRELRADSPAVLAAREWLLREIREGVDEPDIAAADEVKRLGLIADDDER
jgi:hypothetical protein